MPKAIHFLKKLTPRTVNVKRKVKAIRRKPRPEQLNESHAREFLARKLILPAAKKQFGENLRAILIYGSVQQGIRKATAKTGQSDLDLRVVIGEGSSSPKEVSFKYKIGNQFSKLGVPLHMNVTRVNFFKDLEINHKEPFHVIYGKKFVDKLLADAGDAAKKKLPKKNKYNFRR